MLIASFPALAQVSTSALSGRVVDASTEQPLAEVVVVATARELQGERTAVTDGSGEYFLGQLPPGVYTLRFEREGYQAYTRGAITLRLSHRVRFNAQLLPGALGDSEEIAVVGRPPALDVGSSHTGVSVNQEALRELAFRPMSEGASTRSFENLAELAPTAQVDPYGVSLNGTTSPENAFLMDGLSLGNEAFGYLATPLSLEFVQDANVITGGFMPEYGRSVGGIISVATKSGSNELHGSVFSYLMPGLLEAPPTPVRSQGTVIRATQRLWNLGDVGVTLGGPVLKDRLWFFAGVAPAYTRRQIVRSLHRFRLDDRGQEVRDEAGFSQTEPIAGTERTWFADQRTLSYLGKLTWRVQADHTLTLLAYGTPSTSGGEGRLGYVFDRVDLNGFAGTYEALGHRVDQDVQGVGLKLASSFLDKHLLLDATLGWHHYGFSSLGVDGTLPGSGEGLAAIPQFTMRRNRPFYSITDFEQIPDPSVCAPVVTADGGTALPCRVSSYRLGGPGFIAQSAYDRYQANTLATLLFEALGHHILKAGVDLQVGTSRSHNGFSGGVAYAEDTRGQFFQTAGAYGYLRNSEEPVWLPSWRGSSRSTLVGGFVQDSWSVLDRVTLNLGLRYDTQAIHGADGQLALVLPHQLSPRVGLLYDFTRQGRSKLYASFARYQQDVLLALPIVRFAGTPRLGAYYNRAPTAQGPGCDPLTQLPPYSQCQQPGNLLARPGATPQDISRYYDQVTATSSPVDPRLQPQSSDEFVLGAEYELLEGLRLGANYMHRSLGAAIEDMSLNELTSYFIGNPGQGLAAAFPQAVRDYDAVTLQVSRAFTDSWLVQGSYTWSSLRGNYAGLYRPEGQFLAPNVTPQFDLLALTQNQLGPLPLDHTHRVKLYGARQLSLGPQVDLHLGLGYQGRSGAPINVLGSHYLLGPGTIYILPRGSGGRLPWVHTVDTRVAADWRLAGGMVATLSLDVFNLFNFQAVTQVDELWTVDPVEAVVGGTLADIEGDKLKRRGSDTPVVKNPNYGNPVAYQNPRGMRLGLRLAF